MHFIMLRGDRDRERERERERAVEGREKKEWGGGCNTEYHCI